MPTGHTMSTRKNVIDALEHRPPTRVPYHVRFTKPARDRLAAFYGDPDFEAKLDNCLSVRRPRRWTQVRDNVWEDEFGVQWDRAIDKDIGVVANTLITPETLDEYTFPDPDDPTLYTDFEAGADAAADTLKVAKLSYNLFERAWSLVGMEDLLVCMITDKPFVHELMDRITAFNLGLIEKVCGRDVDAIFFGDDWGQQTGLITGPDLWREFIKPRIARMYSAAKARGKYVFIHSCGRVQGLFDELIECGVDVFNPFQPEVMDVFEIKKRFGGRLSFYGGISTQRTLPFGSVADVKDEVRRLLDEVGANGGYIAAPAHAIPPDAKPENMAAMIEVLQNQ